MHHLDVPGQRAVGERRAVVGEVGDGLVGDYGTLTLNADRDIIFNAAAGWTSGTGGFVLNASRDILFNADVTSSGSGLVDATAGRDITIGSGITVTGQIISLRAAGGNINNTGIFTNNGVIRIGSSTLTLLSGLNGSGVRSDLTLTASNLTLRVGNKGPIELGLNIYFFNRQAEELSGKSAEVKPTDPTAPRVVLHWMETKRESQTFRTGYAMKVEFGVISNNIIPGKIFLCLPDGGESWVAGTFRAEIHKPAPPKGRAPNAPSMPHTQ